MFKEKVIIPFRPQRGRKCLKNSPLTLDEIADDNGKKRGYETSIYFYHPDHLGTNTLITDLHGDPYQFFVNLPYGETMIEQSNIVDYDNPYKFNGKELDTETGLYYYGARYYDPKLSGWLSVDPLAEEFTSQTPYAAFSCNPIINIDPDGQAVFNSVDGYKDLKGNYKWYDNQTADVIHKDDKIWSKITDSRIVFDMVASGMLDNIPEQSDPGEIQPYTPNFFGGAEEYLNSPSISPNEAIGKFALGILYGVADDIMVYGSNLLLGPSNARHLNNSGANTSEITNSGVNAITTIVPVGSFGKAIGIGKQSLNASKFGTLFKGGSVLKGSHNIRGINIRKYNHTIRTNNSFNSTFPYFNYSPLLLNPSSDTK